jgi:predicted nucleotidyltransferase
MARQTSAHGSEAEIPAALARELGGVQFALLFGSFGTPYFSGQSDVDVAVQFPQPLSLSARAKRVAALEAAIARNVDLVDLRATDPILALQVLSSGRPLLTNDTKAYHQFAVRT